MRRPLAPLAVVAVVAVAVAGCGAAERTVSPACTESEESIVRALDDAPGPVALADGTRLSECVAQARSDAELQGVGVVLTGAAEQLLTAGARVQLGYLVGAARRGAEHAAGVQAELVRRLESTAWRAGDDGALRRGARAGERDG